MPEVMLSPTPAIALAVGQSIASRLASPSLATTTIESAFIAPDGATQQTDGKLANCSAGRQLARRCICCNTTTSLAAAQQADKKK
jgi:hypothetical protein